MPYITYQNRLRTPKLHIKDLPPSQADFSKFLSTACVFNSKMKGRMYWHKDYNTMQPVFMVDPVLKQLLSCLKLQFFSYPLVFINMCFVCSKEPSH